MTFKAKEEHYEEYHQYNVYEGKTIEKPLGSSGSYGRVGRRSVKNVFLC